MNDIQFKFPELYQFFGGYFYQGWTEDYRWENETPNFKSIVRHFKSINPSLTITQVRIELEELIRQQFEEKELSEILQNLGSNFYPQAVNLTYHEWLDEILQIFNEAASQAKILRELC